MHGYIFRKIRPDEVAQFFRLIMERVQWMDRVGIEHWNKYEYDRLFPPAYYEEKCEKGELYVLAHGETEEILSGAVLLEADRYWNYDETPAYYLHNFVAKLGAKGAGSIFLEEVENLARTQGKKCVRVDVLVTSQGLARYYASRGYVEKGTCQDGNYAGILREKPIAP